MRLFNLLVCAFLLAVTLAAGARAQEPPANDRLKLSPFQFETEGGQGIRSEWGVLKVPENRADPEGRTVELAFVRIPSLAAEPGPPIVYLSGGPGSSAIATARGVRAPVLLALREVGDLILLDQRGTGSSRPAVVCQDSWLHSYDAPLERQEAFEAIEARARACAETMKKAGASISSYNVLEIADDLEDLRQALGAPQISLVATSYGTRLALEAVRRHEASIHRAVLIGVVGPDQVLKLPRLIQQRLEEIDASGSGRSLAETIKRVLAGLDEPVTVTAFDPLDGKDVEIKTSRFDLQLATIRALETGRSLTLLERAYERMSKGDFSPLARDIFRARRKWLGRVMPYAVLCSSGVSRERWQEIVKQGEDAVLGRWLDFPFPEICPALGVEALGDEVRSPIRSPLPVLMISGTLDMRTPVENAEEVLRGFPNGHHLVVEGAGHGDDLIMASPEIERSLVSFLQGDAVTAERIVAEPLWKRPVPHPPTVVRSVVEKLHGLEVEDPYRWLEDPTTPETRLWIETQTQTADSVLHVLPGRRQLQEHFEDLLQVETAGRPWVRGERYVYPRRNAGQDLYSIVLREGEKGDEQVLIDPAALSADSSKSVRILDVSADGGLLAYSIQEGGEDEVEVGFFDLDERRPLADRLPRTRYFSVSVLPGDHGVYYAREAVAGEGGRLYLHRPGTDPATDREVFGDGYGRGTTVWANLSDDGRYLVAHALSATGQRVDVFVKNLAEGGDFLEAVKGVESTFYGGVQGDVLVVQTDWQAPRGRVLVADPDHPQQAGWREVIPEHEKAVIRTVFGAGGKLFVEYLEDVQSRLAIFDIEGRELGEVPFPAIGSLHGIRGQWDQDDVYFSFSSFHIPVSIYRYEVATGALSVWSKAEASIAPEQFEVRQVWYPSKDGTQVPMFLIHPRDLKLDGSNPTLLTGYGGFSTSLTPAFSEETAAWIERGGVYVVANVRGGGELGEEWHQAAVRENKQRSFDDFIAAAEWLIEKGYTRPEKLALSGHSNGGLLVAAAMIQKPELFRAVVCSHALLDMVRYNRFLAARFWLPEFGSPELPEYFWPIFDYSPYHRLTKGTTYPAVLFITAADDTRVAALHARKMTARMQTLATPERPVLLRHYALGGHEVQGRPLSLRIDELTDTLSFLFWQLDEL